MRLEGIPHVQGSALLQEKDRHRRELLRDGSDAETRLWGVGDAAANVSPIVASTEQNASRLCHQHCTTELLGRYPLFERRIGSLRCGRSAS
jgi:hypothetical protein